MQRSRSEVFANQLGERAAIVAEKLYEALVLPDMGAWLAKTGSFLRGTNLRSKRNRAAFSIIMEASAGVASTDARFWTKRMVSEAIAKVIQDHGLEIPMLPGFVWATWLKEQTALLHPLAKKALRNSKSMSAVDVAGTMPLWQEDRSWVLSQRLQFELRSFKLVYYAVFMIRIFMTRLITGDRLAVAAWSPSRG